MWWAHDATGSNCWKTPLGLCETATTGDRMRLEIVRFVQWRRRIVVFIVFVYGTP